MTKIKLNLGKGKLKRCRTFPLSQRPVDTGYHEYEQMDIKETHDPENPFDFNIAQMDSKEKNTLLRQKHSSNNKGNNNTPSNKPPS